MGLFRRSHQFRPSPLSLSVPLDGCDSVVGLQELQRRKDTDLLAKALNLTAPGAPGKAGQRQRHGPSLWDLNSKDLQQKPKPWLDFLWGSGWSSYNACESLSHLGQRVEENLVHWLPNYLRVLLGILIIMMLVRPRSIIGLILLAAFALCSPMLEIYNREKRAEPKQHRNLTFRQLVWEAVQQRSAQWHAAALRVQQLQEQQQQGGSGQSQGGQPQSGSSGDELARNWGFMICTFAVFYTGLPGVVSRAALYTVLVTLGHCSLRQTPSEHAAALKNLGQTGRMQGLGVPFLEVVGIRRSSNPDPRRLMKEAWSRVAAVASAAGIYCWHAAQSKCWNSLRYFRR